MAPGDGDLDRVLRPPGVGITALALLLAGSALYGTATLAWSADEATGDSLVARFAGSYDSDALLREPCVAVALDSLLGREKNHFLENIDVRGSIDLVSNTLSLTGNAPHHGGEEEGVLCISAPGCSVSAGLLSGGTITVFSTAAGYDNQNLCIKDWITQVNSGHRDRFYRPANVTVVSGKLNP